MEFERFPESRLILLVYFLVFESGKSVVAPRYKKIYIYKNFKGGRKTISRSKCIDTQQF